MTIKNISFLRGWNSGMRIKVMIAKDGNDPIDLQSGEVVLENDEAARILTATLNAGARLTLAAGQKLYRIEAVPQDNTLWACDNTDDQCGQAGKLQSFSYGFIVEHGNPVCECGADMIKE